MRKLVFFGIVASSLMNLATPASAVVIVTRDYKYVSLDKPTGYFPTGIYQPDRMVTLDLNGGGDIPPGNGCPITTTDVLSGCIRGR